MKKLVLILMIIVSILMVGCKKNTYPKSYSESPSILLSPKIGEINKVEIGETMYLKTYISNKRIKVLSGYVHTDKADKKRKIPIRPKDHASNFLKITEEGYNTLCYSWLCISDTLNDGYLDSWWDTREDIKKYFPLVKKEKYSLSNIYTDEYFKNSILFQGRVDNKIKISYREFIGSTARPAFTQDVQYEVDNKGHAMIGFKGLRIKVLEATNLDIKYKVLKDFN